MSSKGIKKQVLGGVLFCLGIITAFLSRTIGFELDNFYIVIGIFGVALFLYGSIQKKQLIISESSCSVDGRKNKHKEN
jgi:predicted cation transporter